jgi:hypothetical protein
MGAFQNCESEEEQRRYWDTICGRCNELKTACKCPQAGREAGSECMNLLSGERWKLARKEFTQMADKQGWDLNEHPLHALYLNGDTQLYWEIFKAGFTAAT